jgi:hypothetical protein
VLLRYANTSITFELSFRTTPFGCPKCGRYDCYEFDMQLKCVMPLMLHQGNQTLLHATGLPSEEACWSLYFPPDDSRGGLPHLHLASCCHACLSTPLATPSMWRPEGEHGYRLLGNDHKVGLRPWLPPVSSMVHGDTGMGWHPADDYTAAPLVKLRYGTCSIRSNEIITTLTAVHLIHWIIVF